MTPVPGAPSDSGAQRIRLRDLSGCFSPGFDSPALLEWIGGFREHPGLVTVRAGRNALFRLSGSVEERSLDLGIKSFGREPWIKQALDRHRGSKAERSWRVAMRMASAGVGTPAPVGFLERWEGLRLAESYYLCSFREGTPTFKDELLRLLREKAPCADFLRLMETIAREIRRMHDAGVLHNDLGNQNIFVSRLPGGGWGGVEFFDLNRADLVPAPSRAARGRDLARIHLPPRLRRVFYEMYWAPEPVPRAFDRAEALTRARYRLHTLTRKWRHPFREARVRRERDPATVYPPIPDMWVWDDRSEQPVDLLSAKCARRDRDARPQRRSFRVPPGLRKEYNALLAGAFSRPVDMSSRVGVVLSARPESWETEAAFLRPLGNIPVLVRLPHHDPAAADFAAEQGRRLHAEGREVSFAFLQDRAAVLDLSPWAAFVDRLMERIAPFAAEIEIGHAINQPQWGLPDPSGYAALAGPFAAWKNRFPGLRLCGPAVADFDFPAATAALRGLPGGLTLDGVSYHLEVEGLRSPESGPGTLDLVGQLARARALARQSGRSADRLVLSELSGPMPDAAAWAAAGRSLPEPDGEDCAHLMIHTLLDGLCSGLVERAYWRHPGPGGLFPAVLEHFTGLMTGARFVAREEVAGAVRFHFSGQDGAPFNLVYAPNFPAPLPEAWRTGRFFDARGFALPEPPSRLNGRIHCVR